MTTTVLTSVNAGSRWKGRRGLGSGERAVLPRVGQASGGRALGHTLPGRRRDGEEDEHTEEQVMLMTELVQRVTINILPSFINILITCKHQYKRQNGSKSSSILKYFTLCLL